jgi:hypothetical protein
MRLTLPATPAQYPDGRRRFGGSGRFWGRGEVRSGLKVSEVEILQEGVVGQSTIWVSQATPNKHLQPNCYPLVFELCLASQVGV